MSFTRNIRETQAQFWPTVQESIERHRKSREAVSNGTQTSSSAQHRARRSMLRVVFDETIWALAKDHRICTTAQADVIDAAKVWAKEFDLLDDPIEADRKLYAAVQALAVDFDPHADEPIDLVALLNAKASRTVPDNTPQH